MRLFFRLLFFPVLALASARLSAVNPGLANLAARGMTSSGGDALIVGFVIGPGPAHTVLLRAVGPGLQPFAVPNFATDPAITLFDSTGTQIHFNDDGIAAAAVASNAVGAFPLPPGGKDAALVRALAPGAYTARINSRGSDGIALAEIYDTTPGPSGLLNLSVRAQIGQGASGLIPGLVVAPGGMRRVLLRAAGPALAAFRLTGTVADPALALTDSATQAIVATNDNWDATNDPAAFSNIFFQAGAFPFPRGSKDAALIADLQPGNYTAQVSSVDGTPGRTLVEVYDITPAHISTVTVTALSASVDATGSHPAVFHVARTGDLSQALTVSYATSGSAGQRTDRGPVPGSVTIAAGAASADIAVAPLPDLEFTPATAVTLTLAPDLAYFIGRSPTATATVTANPATLYIATLRPESTASSSTASGSAALVLNGAGTIARVTLSSSNLSSPATAAYLRIGAAGTELLTLPLTATGEVYWNIQSTAAYTAADIVNAIKSGLVFVDLATMNFPAGELRGTLVQGTGSQSFTPPPAPPALADDALSPGAAARFLTQTTFGPVPSDIDSLTGAHLAELDRWISAQMSLPATSHLDATRADYALEKQINLDLHRDPDLAGYTNRRAAWWKIALGANDQLRQRVAFALSELFVISDENVTVYDWTEGAANYYDLLVRSAFGNFRDLLEQVTLNPMMGVYLSHVKNAKAAGGAFPDENYAREVMQLFTIGLNQLQPDGTLRLDARGLPIPTYDQTTVTEMARVFTGWGFFQTVPDATFRSGGGRIENFLNPMQLYPAFHDDGAKTVVGGVHLPANQGGAADLKITLDALFQHPNTAPFIARQLIQRLVTSNPSPGYVYRVAKAFADNGAGVRGDLGAVVRAILLDYEARSPAVAANIGFGRLKEPLLRVTAVMRALPVASNNGRFSDIKVASPELDLAQAPLRSPSVFNFFSPDYVQPGPLASAGLVVPEFQIHTSSTAITVANYFFTLIANDRPADLTSTRLYLNFSSLLPNARNPAALLEQLNVLFCGGAMPASVRDRIAAMLTAFPSGATDLDRVRNALYLTVATAAAAVQK